MERRILGKETITTVNGEEKEVIIKSMGFIEKIQLIKKHTSTKFINGFTYKDVDEPQVMIEVLKNCVEGATLDELDYNTEYLYKKYFEKKKDKEEEKKDVTSTTSHLGTE